MRFHHSKLNFKWPASMETVHWHQDIQFWPHTNYTPLTVGVYLRDVTPDMGPMEIVPLSLYDQLHPLADPATGAFTGVLAQQDLVRACVRAAAPTHVATPLAFGSWHALVARRVPNGVEWAKPTIGDCRLLSCARHLDVCLSVCMCVHRRGCYLAAGQNAPPPSPDDGRTGRCVAAARVNTQSLASVGGLAWLVKWNGVGGARGSLVDVSVRRKTLLRPPARPHACVCVKGTVTVHNARCVHSSAPNLSQQVRGPLRALRCCIRMCASFWCFAGRWGPAQ